MANFAQNNINIYDKAWMEVIKGLWGIAFASSKPTMINTNWLYLAAGLDDEKHRIFGYIKK